MNIFNLKKYFPLILIILIGSAFRFLYLSNLPVSPNWDEVSHGVNAYSILMTGKDEWGIRLPLIFRAFGDYKLPLYIYLTVLPVWLLGLSVFSIRFISAFSGVLAIPAIYLLTKELFPEKKYRLPLLSAFLLAISPWHFFISRPALEANLALTLIIFGFYYLLRFFKSRSSLLPSVILLGLSLHAYNTARVFVPLLIILSLAIYRPKIKLNFKTGLALLLALLFSGLVVFQVFVGEGTARYDKLKILSPTTVFQIGKARTQSGLSPNIARLVYNRPVYFFTTVTKNYLSYLSPAFFAQKWGAQFQFAIPNKNLLTLPVFILAFLGLILYLPKLKTEKSLQ
ncbi:MAG: glycosyltransferase family 39 protein, partial [bacterium]